MNKTILLAILTWALCSVGYVVGQNSIQVYDGTTLSVGDTIRLGQKQYSNERYNEIKEPVKTEFGIHYNLVVADLALEAAKVIDCKPLNADKIFSGGRPVIVVQTDQHPTELYVNIDRAVEKGEIAWVYQDHTTEDAIELTPELMLACCIRSNKLPVTDFVLQYLIKVKDSKLYWECMSDEFKYNKTKPEYEQMLREMMDEFDFTKTYYIKAQLSIDKYNFPKQGYPVDFCNSRKSDWTNQHFISYGDFDFLPTNRSKFKFVSVTPENGERANAIRKGISNVGYISPSAYGRTYIKLLDKRMELPKNSMLNMEKMFRQSVIGAEIIRVEVYDFPNCDYNLIGTIQ